MTCEVIELTMFDAIKGQVTARDAAEMYGLKFGQNKRACCPWHDDTHPDLSFYDSGLCYCHACHQGGDSIALTAQIFGLSMVDAARKLNADFNLGVNTHGRISSAVRNQIEQRRIGKEKKLAAERQEWDFLCKVRQEAENRLETIVNAADPEHWDRCWDDPEFVKALSYRVRADMAFDWVWETRTVIRS